MTRRNDLVEELRDQVIDKLNKILGNKAKHSEMIKSLIVQGLVKMLEPVIRIRCLKKDTALVESLREECEQEFYGELLANTVVDIKVKTKIDEDNQLNLKRK